MLAPIFHTVAPEPTALVLYGSSPLPREIVFGRCREALRLRTKLRDRAEVWSITAADAAASFEFEVAWFPEGLIADLLPIALDAAETYCEVVDAGLPRIKSVLAERAFKNLGGRSSWDQLSHVVTAGLIVDVGIGERVVRAGLISEVPAHCWVWAFEGGTKATNAFGVQRWVGSGGRSVCQLWHQQTRRKVVMRLNPGDVDLLHDISDSDGIEGDLLARTAGPDALKLLFYKLLRRGSARVHVNIPLLNCIALTNAIEDVTQRLLERAVLPAMVKATAVFRGGCVTERGQDSILKHGFARLLLEHATDRLIQRQLISPFPACADTSWAAWLTR